MEGLDTSRKAGAWSRSGAPAIAVKPSTCGRPRYMEGLDTSRKAWNLVTVRRPREGLDMNRAAAKARSFMRLFECFALHLVTDPRPGDRHSGNP